MSITEKQLTEEYRVIRFWTNGLRRALYNSRTLGAGDESRMVRNEVSRVLYSTEEKIDAAFVVPMGKAVQAKARRRA